MLQLLAVVALLNPLGLNPHTLVDKDTGIHLKIPANWSWQDSEDIKRLPICGLWAGFPVFFCHPYEVLRNGRWSYNTSGSTTMDVYEIYPAEAHSTAALATRRNAERFSGESKALVTRFGANDWSCFEFRQGSYSSIDCRGISPFGKEFFIEFRNATLKNPEMWHALLASVTFVKPARSGDPIFWTQPSKAHTRKRR